MQKKITLSLDNKLVEEVQRLVKEGRAKSQSEFFGEALEARIQQLEREEWRRAMIDASKDPMFLSDVEQVTKDFEHADAESARMIQ